MVERHLVRTPLGYVHLRSTGEAADAGTSILLLHQVPSSGRVWLPVMDLLSPRRCIAPDLLNLGESDHSSRPLDLGEHAEILWEAAQTVAPGPMVVVGHHTGAALALHLAAKRRELVTGLGLIAPPFYETWEERFARFGAIEPVTVAEDGTGLVEAWRSTASAFEPGASDDLRLAAFADKLRGAPIWFEAHVTLLATDLVQLVRDAADPTRPTTLLAPDQDRFSGVAAQRVGELLGVTPTVAPGGSYVLVEHPEVIAKHVAALEATSRD